MKVCKVCGSDDIHVMVWIGVNDRVYKSSIDVKDNIWCESCKDHVKTKRVSFKNSYKKPKK